MGVRHLDTFIRKKVPNGCFKVNIENEIREYYSKGAAAGSAPLPPPVIVIDLCALSCELGVIDFDSLIFGARYNVGFWIIDKFLQKFTALGAVLQFFTDGTVQASKLKTWSERRDKEYQELIPILDAVDAGADVEKILATEGAPGCGYALEYLAKKHGKLTVSLERECDQELAAYACKVNALAIISNDSDFLIYGGRWRLWSSKELDIDTLETLEYNRPALLRHLRLTYEQMPLFATLCGNDIMTLEELKRFHFSLGQYSRKINNVADLVGVLSDPAGVREVMLKAFGQRFFRMETRFQQSLNFYRTDYTTEPGPSNDPVAAIFLRHPNAFVYQIWHKQPHAVTFGMVDMRSAELGQQLPDLVLRILSRTAGIVAYHRPKNRRPSTHPFVFKPNHEGSHRCQNYPVQYPSSFKPPPLVELFSPDPTVMANLEDRKLRALSWIVSDRLDYRRLKPIVRPLLPTVVTLCHLVENHVFRLFEADLLLAVAYSVVTESYDPAALEFPTTVDGRPFRLAFFYRIMYRFVSDAMDSIGLNLRGFREDPPFDGVLFHRQYAEWAESPGDTGNIKQWRIYADLC